MLIRPKPDRRRPPRLVPPGCPECKANAEALAVVSRQGDVIQFKCTHCGAEVGEQKPTPPEEAA